MYVFDSHFDDHAVARQILQDYKVIQHLLLLLLLYGVYDVIIVVSTIAHCMQLKMTTATLNKRIWYNMVTLLHSMLQNCSSIGYTHSMMV
jgi:hypothetical protein